MFNKFLYDVCNLYTKSYENIYSKIRYQLRSNFVTHFVFQLLSCICYLRK